MSKKGEYRYFDKSGLNESSEAAIPAGMAVASKIHIDVYLKVKGVPLWERGGMRAFAMSKGSEFATEQAFEALFAGY